MTDVDPALLVRRTAEAKRVIAEAYPFKCCAVCGLQLDAALDVAHIDQKPGNNDPDNLVWLCKTHHWMFDAKLYPAEAIRLLRSHWQTSKGIPNHADRMKEAGVKAARKRIRSAAGRKAAATKRANAALENAE